MNFKVLPLKEDEVYRDFCRIPEVHRKDSQGMRIREGTICEVSADGRKTLAYLRGAIGEAEAVIRLDEKSRNDLGVVVGKEYDLTLRVVGTWDQFRWAWDASDPTPRIAARLGVLSLVLGIISTLLAIWSVYLTS